MKTKLAWIIPLCAAALLIFLPERREPRPVRVAPRKLPDAIDTKSRPAPPAVIAGRKAPLRLDHLRKNIRSGFGEKPANKVRDLQETSTGALSRDKVEAMAGMLGAKAVPGRLAEEPEVLRNRIIRTLREDPDPQVREAALDVLARLPGDAHTRAALENATLDPSSAVAEKASLLLKNR